jgi:hypothetical protein
MKTKKTPVLVILISLMLFQAASAIPSALTFIIDPSGSIIGLPLSHLGHSPFHNFLIPGLFLLIILGIVPAITAIGLIRPFRFYYFEVLNLYPDQHWSWTFTYYTGIVLIMWINIQLLLIREWDYLHLIYSVLGLIIIILVQLPSVKDELVKQN